MAKIVGRKYVAFLPGSVVVSDRRRGEGMTSPNAYRAMREWGRGRLITQYHAPGFYWVRFWGWGLLWKRVSRHGLLFSERVLGHGLRLGDWHFRLLKPGG